MLNRAIIADREKKHSSSPIHRLYRMAPVWTYGCLQLRRTNTPRNHHSQSGRHGKHVLSPGLRSSGPDCRWSCNSWISLRQSQQLNFHRYTSVPAISTYMRSCQDFLHFPVRQSVMSRSCPKSSTTHHLPMGVGKQPDCSVVYNVNCAVAPAFFNISFLKQMLDSNNPRPCLHSALHSPEPQYPVSIW